MKIHFINKGRHLPTLFSCSPTSLSPFQLIVSGARETETCETEKQQQSKRTATPKFPSKISEKGDRESQDCTKDNNRMCSIRFAVIFTFSNISCLDQTPFQWFAGVLTYLLFRVCVCVCVRLPAFPCSYSVSICLMLSL